MTNNTFSKTSIIWVFQRNVFFFWRLQCTKKLRILHFVHGSEAQSQMEVFFRFFPFLLPFRNSIMTKNTFSKTSIIVFINENLFYFEDCNVPKNCEILHFVHGSEAQSQMEVFFDFFPFYYRLGKISCQITLFQNLSNWSFSTKFYFIFEDCNVPKNCEILHFVHGSEAQSQMEVFFGFFSFYYRLGKISCQITLFQNLSNWSFSTKFYFIFEDCNVPKNCWTKWRISQFFCTLQSSKKNKISLKNLNYWIFWKSVIWHDTVPNR